MKTILFLLLVGSSFSLLAQGPPKKRKQENFVALGIFIQFETEEYDGEGVDLDFFPIVQFRYEKLKLQGPGLAYEAAKLGPLALDVTLFYDSTGFDDDDSTSMDGMDERGPTMAAGLQLSTKMFFPWALDLAWNHDLLSKSNGWVGEFGVGYMWRPTPKLMLKPGASVEFLSEKYADYYYGVRPEEARTNRPFYAPDGLALRPEIGVLALYFLDDKVSLMLKLETVLFPSEMKDSPIISKSHQEEISFGTSYKF
jgi:outer membrane protein